MSANTSFCRCLLVVVVCFYGVIPYVSGHGRLLDPPGRSTMWRQGWNTPPNYNDNELFCGGFDHQWNTNNGRCGLCGDPYDGARDNEWGGPYATGIVVRHYKKGDVITLVVEVTANHLGWFEFRMCPQDEPLTPATQACLDNHLLTLADGTTRFAVTTWAVGLYNVSVRLPADVTCDKCLLQWKYHAGNSWGIDAETGEGCVGCGPQEEFYACADVKISVEGGTVSMPTTTATTTTVSPTPVVDIVCEDGVYVASETYANDPNMTPWCQNTCPTGYCPSSHCQCGNP